MNRRRILCFVLCFSFLFTSGCWDRKELNDRAIWLATGFDIGEKKEIQAIGQVVIPSNMPAQTGGGGTEKDFFVISEHGINGGDALQNLQRKLSREAFLGQRRVVFFGEEFAKRGLKTQLDGISRNSDISLRTDVFVVKGATAREALNLSYPLEKTSAVAALKVHSAVRGNGETTFLNFLIGENIEGFSATLPVIEISHAQSGNEDPSNLILSWAGVAIFDQDLKLRGYLNMDENRYVLWLLGILKKLTIAAPIKDGNVGLVLTDIKSKIVPEISGNNRIKFNVTLTGKGDLQENNTNLDVMNPKNLQLVQDVLEQETKKHALKTITKVQNEYGLDIFSFGETIHRKYPYKWKALKKNWFEKFAEADISVNVNLTIRRVGMTRSSTLFPESEINK